MNRYILLYLLYLLLFVILQLIFILLFHNIHVSIISYDVIVINGSNDNRELPPFLHIMCHFMR